MLLFSLFFLYTSVFQPTSPGVLPVSVPFNPSKPNSGAAPTLKIPLPKRTFSHQTSQETSSPSSTTSTPTNPTTVNPTTVHSSSEPSSPSTSPSTANPPNNTVLVANQEGPSIEDARQHTSVGDDERVEPYVSFTEFFKVVQEHGEEVVYGSKYTT